MVLTIIPNERPGPPAEWKADGCDVAPHCLECPLDQCKFDDIRAYQQWRKTEHHRQIVATIEAEGFKPQKLSSQFGLSVRTIFRIRGRNFPRGGVVFPNMPLSDLPRWSIAKLFCYFLYHQPKMRGFSAGFMQWLAEIGMELDSRYGYTTSGKWYYKEQKGGDWILTPKGTTMVESKFAHLLPLGKA